VVIADTGEIRYQAEQDVTLAALHAHKESGQIVVEARRGSINDAGANRHKLIAQRAWLQANNGIGAALSSVSSLPLEIAVAHLNASTQTGDINLRSAIGVELGTPLMLNTGSSSMRTAKEDTRIIDLMPIHSLVEAGETYGVTIADTSYSYQAEVGDDVANIATGLAAKINADPAYTAVANEETRSITINDAGDAVISGPQVALPSKHLGLKALSGGHVKLQVQSDDLVVCEADADQQTGCVTTTDDGTITLLASGSGGKVVLNAPVKSAKGNISVMADGEVEQQEKLQTDTGVVDVSERSNPEAWQSGLLLLLSYGFKPRFVLNSGSRSFWRVLFGFKGKC
jgi:hypothetical protein